VRRLMLLLVALVPLVVFAVPASGQNKVPADEQVLNIGHRGASGLAPEHTFPAYDLALKQGANYIEQDLQLTADGVLVVLHDETLDRTARPTEEASPGDCTGLVRTKTLAQIKTCEVGSWFNETYPQYAKPGYVGLEIPTLEQVFKRYGKSTNYYIETKSPAAAVMEEELLRLMGKYDLLRPAARHWRVLIQSFSPDSLQKLHASAPELPLIQLYTRSDSQTIQATLDAARTYAVGIGPAKDNVDASLVAAAHNCCLDIHPYTVSEKVGCRTSSPSGWTALFTNFPMRLDEVLGRNAVGNDIEAGNRATRNSEACRKGTRGSAS
jgi:glycerophosphoryl diester phosphodiesterase